VSTQSPQLRPILDGFRAYVPGKVPVSPDGRTFKLSSNETPFGPLPSVTQVIVAAAAGINRYPDNGAVALTDAIARRFGVQPGQVAVGCGSVGVAQQLLMAAAEPGTEAAYAAVVRGLPDPDRPVRRRSVQVLLASATHDPDAMADAITDRTRLIFVCNPNNPTGTVSTGPS
jgi:histidinol-phosphate aminotransferase